MEDFRIKAFIVVGGDVTHMPEVITYSTVVIREIVHIALIMASSDDKEIKAAEVLNTYMMAPNREIIWTILGLEFGNDIGKSAVIVRALYRLKSACSPYRAHLAKCMNALGHQSCMADLNLLWEIFMHTMLD